MPSTKATGTHNIHVVGSHDNLSYRTEGELGSLGSRLAALIKMRIMCEFIRKNVI